MSRRRRGEHRTGAARHWEAECQGVSDEQMSTDECQIGTSDAGQARNGRNGNKLIEMIIIQVVA